MVDNKNKESIASTEYFLLETKDPQFIQYISKTEYLSVRCTRVKEYDQASSRGLTWGFSLLSPDPTYRIVMYRLVIDFFIATLYELMFWKLIEKARFYPSIN